MIWKGLQHSWQQVSASHTKTSSSLSSFDVLPLCQTAHWWISLAFYTETAAQERPRLTAERWGNWIDLFFSRDQFPCIEIKLRLCEPPRVWEIHSLPCLLHNILVTTQGPVVRRVDSFIQRINPYPVWTEFACCPIKIKSAPILSAGYGFISFIKLFTLVQPGPVL